MKIREIDVDGFGVWQGLKFQELPDSALVIYGPNEAGKTTLMQFVRTILYGFSQHRRARYVPPVNGGRPGGRLCIGSAAGDFIVERYTTPDTRSEDRGNVHVIDADGKPAEAVQLVRLLAGVDEPTFNNVFACGLREIQELGSLDDTRAAELLYKLTTGLDRVSLIDVIRELGASRDHLLGMEEGKGQIPQLMSKRDRLKAEIYDRSSATRKWSELSAQRTSLADEAKDLEAGIAETEANSRVVQAALEVQSPWHSRSDTQRQLALLKDVKSLPEKAVEKLEGYSRKLLLGRKRMQKLRNHWRKLRGEAMQMTVNKLIITQATRIEAMNEHSQWIVGLESQIGKLKEEIRRLDDEIQLQLGGITGGKGSANIDELTAESYAQLKRPAAALREESEKVEIAKKDVEAAQLDAERVTSKLSSAARNRQLDDLHESIHTAGEKVAMLRRRIQVEERLDQLSRRREELEFSGEEMHEYQETPFRVTAALGLFFATGFMLVMLGLLGHRVVGLGTYFFPPDGNVGATCIMFGFLLSFGAFVTKLMVDRNGEDSLTDNHRAMEQLRMQLAEAKQQRDDLDAELPGSGSLDVRLREAETELREYERLSPLTSEHEAAKDRHEAAHRRHMAAQESHKEARSKWKATLRALGLPEDFAPTKVKHVVRSNDQAIELRRRRDSKRDELEGREREMLVLVARIKQLMGDLRIAPNSLQPLAQLQQLAHVLQQEKEMQELRTTLVVKMKKLKRKRTQYENRLRQAARRQNALFMQAGVNDVKSFRQVAADSARATDLRRVEAELTSRIQASLAGQFTEEAIAAVFKREGRDLQSRWNQRTTEMQEARSRLGNLHERRGACTAEMAMLVADRRLSHAQLELGVVEQQLEEASRRWQVLGVVSRVLEIVRKAYETDRQPETLREASNYLEQLTMGHYVRVWMPLDRRELLVDAADGRKLPLDVLSRGTRESVYISLRLALAASFARRGATLPLVLDDVLVNFDTERVRAAAKVFREFSNTGNQILMFTCHEHIMRIFKEAQIEVRTLPSRNGVVEHVIEEKVIDIPVDKPKKRKKVTEQVKAEVVAELPPPEPFFIPEEEPQRLAWPDPNQLLDRASEDEVWFDVVNEFEVKKKVKKPRVKPVEAPVAKVPPLNLPDSWPVVRIDPPRTELPPPVYKLVPKYNLPDQWPMAPIAAAPVRQVVAEPITREVVLGNKILQERRSRFTWESPEMYWEEAPAEVTQTNMVAVGPVPVTTGAVSSVNYLSPVAGTFVGSQGDEYFTESETGERIYWGSR